METAGNPFFFKECCLVAAFGAFVFAAQSYPAMHETIVPTQVTQSPVPFVGCKSDGQTGPKGAPDGRPMVVSLPAKVAERIAYYKAEQGIGVLGPRGWHCFGGYGSNGYSLYVSPEPFDGATLFSDSWRGFNGPAIEIAGSTGDTSGRFKVAQVIARVFPNRRGFVENAIRQGEPASAFPFGPYPKDKLIYRNDDTVEYETPANREGLGTQSRLMKNSHPIRGVAILAGDAPDLLQLSLRLPPEFAELGSIIVHQVEADATQSSDDSN